jgi:molybdopterin converting factor small subunit
MADAIFELHGFLARRLEALGSKHGSRIQIQVPVRPGERVGDLLERLTRSDERFTLLYDNGRLPEHVEVVLNDRVLDLQGGLEAALRPGDVLSFLPAHAGG